MKNPFTDKVRINHSSVPVNETMDGDHVFAKGWDIGAQSTDRNFSKDNNSLDIQKTLRDEVAIAVLHALIDNQGLLLGEEKIVDVSFKYADEYMRQRGAQ